MCTTLYGTPISHCSSADGFLVLLEEADEVDADEDEEDFFLEMGGEVIAAAAAVGCGVLVTIEVSIIGLTADAARGDVILGDFFPLNCRQ